MTASALATSNSAAAASARWRLISFRVPRQPATTMSLRYHCAPTRRLLDPTAGHAGSGCERDMPQAKPCLGASAIGPWRKFEQGRSVLSALIDIADHAKPFRNIGAVEPAARMYGKVAGESLDMADVALAEADGCRAEEVLLCGKQRVGCIAVLMPGDDGDGLIALHQRMRPPLLQVH